MGGRSALVAALGATMLFASSAQASPLVARRANPALVTPAQLHAVTDSLLEADFESSSYAEEQRWDDGNGPGKIRERTSGQRFALSYAWHPNPSVTTAVRSQRFHDETTIERPFDRFDGERTLLVLGLDGAYKIMDKVVLGLGLSERRARLASSSSGDSKRRYVAVQPALLVKSEWYEIGLSQIVYAIERRQEGGNDRLGYYRELLLHATYSSSAETSIGVTFRRNPHPTCCLAADSKRRSYTATYTGSGKFLAVSAALTYLPSQFERASFGPVYDTARYRLATLTQVTVGAVDLGVAVGYEYANDSAARVEILDLPNTITQAAVSGAGWQLGVTLATAI